MIDLEIAQKQRQLSRLQERIRQKDKEIRQQVHESSRLNRRLRTRKLIQGGCLFEQAGILDQVLLDVNHERVMCILKNLEGKLDKAN